MYLCYAWDSESLHIQAFTCHMENMGIPLVNSMSDKYVDRLEETSLYSSNTNLTEDKYVTIFLTERTRFDVVSLIELNEIQKKFEKGQISVFTIADPKELDQLPKRLRWILDTKIFTILQPVDIHKTVLQIADIYYGDYVYHLIGEKEDGAERLISIIHESRLSSDLFINLLLHQYSMLDENNLSAKMTLLYAIYSYIDLICKISMHQMTYHKCFSYFYQYSGQCIPFDPLQLSIMESCFILAFKEALTFSE